MHFGTTSWLGAALALGLSCLAGPAFADDPVAIYNQVNEAGDTRLGCNDLNIAIANVQSDIGRLEAQEESLQQVIAEGAPNDGPQSTNLGNAFAAMANAFGTAAVVDAESSLPNVQSSLSTARARVGYLESLQGSCAANDAPPPPPPAPPPQAAAPAAPPAPAVDTSEPPPDLSVPITICTKENEKFYFSFIHLSGDGSQLQSQGWWWVRKGCAVIAHFRRGPLWAYAQLFNATQTFEPPGTTGRRFCPSGNGYRQIEPAQCDGQTIRRALFIPMTKGGLTVDIGYDGIKVATAKSRKAKR